MFISPCMTYDMAQQRPRLVTRCPAVPERHKRGAFVLSKNNTDERDTNIRSFMGGRHKAGFVLRCEAEPTPARGSE